MSGVKLGVPWKPPWSWGNLTQALWVCVPWFSPQTLSSGTSWEPLPGRAGGTHQEDGTHLSPPRLAGPQAGPGQCLFQWLSLEHHLGAFEA